MMCGIYFRKWQPPAGVDKHESGLLKFGGEHATNSGKKVHQSVSSQQIKGLFLCLWSQKVSKKKQKKNHVIEVLFLNYPSLVHVWPDEVGFMSKSSWRHRLSLSQQKGFCWLFFFLCGEIWNHWAVQSSLSLHLRFDIFRFIAEGKNTHTHITSSGTTSSTPRPHWWKRQKQKRFKRTAC